MDALHHIFARKSLMPFDNNLMHRYSFLDSLIHSQYYCKKWRHQDVDRHYILVKIFLMPFYDDLTHLQSPLSYLIWNRYYHKK